MKDARVSVALHDVRSVHNVGSVFRTSDAAGVEKIYLCGYTPAPVDRFGRARSDLAKVALGAEENISWELVESTASLIREQKKRGVTVIAIEQAPHAVHIKEIAKKISAFPAGAEILFVFGNETKGLPEEIIKLCDHVAFLPMRGNKESLNVSVSVGIALYCALEL